MKFSIAGGLQKKENRVEWWEDNCLTMRTAAGILEAESHRLAGRRQVSIARVARRDAPATRFFGGAWRKVVVLWIRTLLPFNHVKAFGAL